MSTQADTAIVLRLSDYSESSQIVTLFTRDAGLVRLIAKGVRRSTAKRIAVGLDLLELGDLLFSLPRRGAGLGTLAEWRQQAAFHELRGALATLYSGLYAAEVVTFLSEEVDPHPAVYSALLELLTDLGPLASAAAAQVARRVVAFQSLFASEIGFAPNLDSCISCGRPRPIGAAAYFSAAAGGLLCRGCQAGQSEKQLVRGAVLDAMSPSAKRRDGEAAAAPVAWAVWNFFLQHTAGRAFETAVPLGRLVRAAD